MTKLAIGIDLHRCIGCNTCALACKMQNNVPDGMLWNRVLTEGCDRFDSAEGVYPHLTRTYLPLACQHCENPACERVCPTGATYKDDKGRVEIDYDKCIGCRYCSWACEFGAPQFDRDGLMRKCDLCIDRLREGKRPACVENCCGGALTFGPVEEIEGARREKAARQIQKMGLPAKALHV